MKTFKSIVKANEYLLSIEKLPYLERVKAFKELKDTGSTTVKGETIRIGESEIETSAIRDIELKDFETTSTLNSSLYTLNLNETCDVVITQYRSGNSYMSVNRYHQGDNQVIITVKCATVPAMLRVLNGVVADLNSFGIDGGLSQSLVEKLKVTPRNSNTKECDLNNSTKLNETTGLGRGYDPDLDEQR